jgi:hypothetical protein
LSGGEILNVIINAASQAVSRKEELALVTMEDLSYQIRRIRKAKKEIGNYNYESDTVVREKRVPISELPMSNQDNNGNDND